ncbi:MAG: GAF domain-containing protein [Chloroflexi bacterium]|nr:GAF domain-containing protein [Chloroflexota bacterium]
MFSLLALAVMGGVALLFSYLTSLPLRQNVLDHAVEEAEDTSHEIVRQLKAEDLAAPMSGQRLQAFDSFIHDSVIASDVARVKVWNREARIIYSNDASQIGEVHLDNNDLRRALGGNVARKIANLSKTENEKDRGMGPLMEVYIPLRFPGSSEPQGAVEVYEQYGPFEELIQSQQRVVFGANMIGLVILYSTLLVIAFNTFRRMRRQELILAQREQEAKSAAQLNVTMLNERAKIIEDGERQKGRLADLTLALALAEGSPGPIEMGRELLSLVQKEVGAEFATLTLVEPDGRLGQRVDKFQNMAPFHVLAHPGGLCEAIIKTGRSQYITDTLGNPRANPALVAAGIRSYIGLAIRAEDKLEGILFFHSTRPDAFAEDKSFLESFASICAMPLQRSRLLSYIENAKQELEAVFDAIPSGVVLMDEDRHVLRANRAFARLVSLPVEKVIGPTVCKLLHGKDERLHRCPLDRAFVGSTNEVIAFKEPHLGNIMLSVRTYTTEDSSKQPHRFVMFFSVVPG